MPQLSAALELNQVLVAVYEEVVRRLTGQIPSTHHRPPFSKDFSPHAAGQGPNGFCVFDIFEIPRKRLNTSETR